MIRERTTEITAAHGLKFPVLENTAPDAMIMI